jgi:SAM-dependent methyltransferase
MVWHLNGATCRRLVAGPAVALSCILAGTALAQEPAQEWKPPPIPYVPSPQYVVERMLELAQVNQNDYVIDLGSGDGRIPITAAQKYGARGFGVDINPKLVREATENAKKAGVADQVTFREQDLFETPLGEATVVSLYLPVSVNIKLRPRLLKELRPGTRIVAHQFAIGDWDADVRELVNRRFVYLWYVPAQVQGTWEVTDGKHRFNLHLWQEYQKLSGSAANGQRYHTIQDLFLRGDQINFAVVLENGERRVFHGRIVGEKIVPRTTDRVWHAVRVSDNPRPGGNAN